MASSRIKEALLRAFNQYRIVFWDDKKGRLQDEYDALDLPEVIKIKIDNNEFSVKYRILVLEKEHKFLIYRPKGEPDEKENWLLDVQLASYKFVAEQDTLLCYELGLDPKFAGFLKKYEFFFNRKEQREKLASAISGNSSNETEEDLILKMIGILSPLRKADSFFTILQSLLAEEFKQRENHTIYPPDVCLQMEKEIMQKLKTTFNYQASKLSLYDFVLKAFDDKLKRQLGEKSELSNEIEMFIDSWKDSKNYEDNFNQWTIKVADDLELQERFDKLDFGTLIEIDYFRNIDEMILIKLRDEISNDLISDIDVGRILDIRRNKNWWKKYKFCYETAYAASRFKQHIKNVNLSMSSIEDAVTKYKENWFEVDQLYRKFNLHCRNDKISELFADLKINIDNLYSNEYLRPLAQKFSAILNSDGYWGDFKATAYQANFFEKFVKPFIDRNNKIVVIISDALRYELGDDLTSLINKTNRFSAEIEPMVSVLPSFTQLGMAALLPNNSIGLKSDSTALVNGDSATGIENRKKILSSCGKETFCINAADILSPQIKNSDVKKLIASYDIIYVYHDVMDNAGEKDEQHLFEKSQDCLDELVRLVTKLTSGNANNIIITSDHGFIYQDLQPDKNMDLLESPFINGETYLTDRRFILAKGEIDPSNTDFLSFQSSDLGLSGELSILIPKAIQRIRKQGQNGRYIHGGATLQETVIPVILVNKKRKDDVSEVSVKVISQERTITSGQIAVTFYQEKPVEDKIKGITIRAGFYRNGKAVSNIENMEFYKETQNVEEREQRCQFKIATGIDSGTVVLKLQKKLEGSDRYKNYEEINFTIRQNFFGRDF